MDSIQFAVCLKFWTLIFWECFIVKTSVNLSLKIHLMQSRPKWTIQAILSGLFYPHFQNWNNMWYLLILIPNLLLSVCLHGFSVVAREDSIVCYHCFILQTVHVRRNLPLQRYADTCTFKRQSVHTFSQKMLLLESFLVSSVSIYSFPQRDQITITLVKQNCVFNKFGMLEVARDFGWSPTKFENRGPRCLQNNSCFLVVTGCTVGYNSVSLAFQHSSTVSLEINIFLHCFIQSYYVHDINHDCTVNLCIMWSVTLWSLFFFVQIIKLPVLNNSLTLFNTLTHCQA